MSASHPKTNLTAVSYLACCKTKGGHLTAIHTSAQLRSTFEEILSRKVNNKQSLKMLILINPNLAKFLSLS